MFQMPVGVCARGCLQPRNKPVRAHSSAVSVQDSEPEALVSTPVREWHVGGWGFCWTDPVCLRGSQHMWIYDPSTQMNVSCVLGENVCDRSVIKSVIGYKSQPVLATFLLETVYISWNWAASVGDSAGGPIHVIIVSPYFKWTVHSLVAPLSGGAHRGLTITICIPIASWACRSHPYGTSFSDSEGANSLFSNIICKYINSVRCSCWEPSFVFCSACWDFI